MYVLPTASPGVCRLSCVPVFISDADAVHMLLRTHRSIDAPCCCVQVPSTCVAAIADGWQGLAHIGPPALTSKQGVPHRTCAHLDAYASPSASPALLSCCSGHQGAGEGVPPHPPAPMKLPTSALAARLPASFWHMSPACMMAAHDCVTQCVHGGVHTRAGCSC